MHLAEGMLPMSQAVGWSAVTLPVLIWSMRGEQLERKDNTSSSTIMASVTSLLFAATLLPLPVPIVGATSHICLTPLFALIVGIRRIIWPTFFVLLLQAVFFAHGGLTTLGINTLSLGLFGPIVTIGIWKALLRLGSNSTIGLGIACGIGSLSVYILDALILAVALSDVVQPKTTFFSVLLGFAPVQVPLAILESVVSVKIIQILLNRRVDLLPPTLSTLQKSSIPVGAVMLLLFSSNLSGCDYEGIDGTVFGATAEIAGRPPTDSLIDLSQGELGLAMSIIILFGLGFVAGRSWERLLTGDRNALPR